MNNLLNRKAISNEAQMVRELKKEVPLNSANEKAFLSVNRAAFVPRGFENKAYRLDALPIKGNQFISSPLTVAKMTHYLDPEGCDSVLELGCGSGYQAAILSKLCRRVFSIERIGSLLDEANNTFKRERLNNIMTKHDDAQLGWSRYAPYERILFSATATKIPEALFEQLSEGGILVAPMAVNDKEIITRYTKKSGKIVEETLDVCSFVPVLDGKA
jgi:protein-L-isoaspartate(D-aspartate) O-methyltransferase